MVAKTIWIAEDDPEMRSLLETSLTGAGMNVRTFSDGIGIPKELGEASDRGQLPDALVLDHHMPEMQGLDVVRDARARGIRIPIVMITAFGDTELHQRAKALGVAEVLDKPFALDELHRALGDLSSG